MPVLEISVIDLSPRQLRRAADIKERIDTFRNQLARLFGTPAEAGECENSCCPESTVGEDKGGGPTSRAGEEAQAKDECGGQDQTFSNSQGALKKSAGSGKDNALEWVSKSASCRIRHFVNRR